MAMDTKNLAPLKLSRLHHPEFGQLLVRFYKDFENRNLDPSYDADFAAVFDTLRQNLPEFNAALDQVQADENSKKIAEADRHRDDDLVALRTATKSYRNSRKPAEKEAYSKLTTLLNEYKNVEEDNYEQQTNRLTTLVERLKSAEFSPAVATLALAKFVADLEESNQQFDNLFANRSTQTSRKVSYDVKALRRALSAQYMRLANYAAAMADMKSDPYYKDLLQVVNQGRNYFASVVLARRSGGDDSKDATG